MENKMLFKNLEVQDENSFRHKIHYIEAGAAHLPTLLLLHGYPSSSNQYRDLIPLLSPHYHIIAPDMPGFGLTESDESFIYTFDNLTSAIKAWLAKLHIDSYAMYVFDYGAPVGFRLLMQNPEHVFAIISQNGNAYEEGLGHPYWDASMAFWKTDDNATIREKIRETRLTLDVVKEIYYNGVEPNQKNLVNLYAPKTDYLVNILGREQSKLDLMYDYQTNVKLYPAFQETFRKTQVPLLAVWGRNDPAFVPPGAEAFKRDLPSAEIVILNTGHFALETHRDETAALTRKFLSGLARHETWKEI